MTNFKIEFSFNELDYTADVAKIPLVNGLPVQFHVHNIKPEIANVSNPYFFIHEPQNEQFTF